MPLIEIDEDDDDYLSFAASIAKLSKKQVVKRLIRQAAATAVDPSDPEIGVPIHADYEGHRTRALFVPGPGRVEITDGPLRGVVCRTPSEAARRVVHELNPRVSPHRNG